MVTSKRIYKVVALCGLIPVLALISGCKDDGSRVDSGRRVTVSVAPLEYFVNHIGGDSVSVSVLMGSGADPETFQPGMGVMRDLNRSGLLLVTGVLPFENKVTADIEESRNGVNIGVAGKGINYMYGTHSHDHDNDPTGYAHEDGDMEKGEPDPHIWGSVKNGKILARNTNEFLKGAFPELSDYFDERCAALCMRLDSIDEVYARRLIGVDAFAIWHPSLSYFARDYGLEQIALNLENKETSPRRLKEIADHALVHRPKAFFIPEGLAQNRVATLSEALGVVPTEVNFMDGDLERQLNAVVDALTSNIQGGYE